MLRLWKAMGVVVLALAAIEPQAEAELSEGWEFQLAPMLMAVKGFDQHVGNIIRQTGTRTFGPGFTPPFTFTESRIHDPINLSLDSGPAVRGQVTYRKAQWGFGVSGWLFNTNDSVSGRVTTPPPIVTGTSITTSESFASLWQEPRGCVLDTTNPSSCAPEKFQARADLNTFTIDVFALRTLAEKPSSRIDLMLGAKIGRLKTELDQRLSMTALLLPPFFVNNISLGSTAKTEFMGVGPVVGLQGEAQWRRLGLQAFLTQALLIGKTDQRGLFTDIDDIRIFGNPFFLIRSDVPFSKSETMFIPVTEFQLKATVAITRWLSIGANGFVALWMDAPVTPKFVFPTVNTVSFPDRWELQERTLRFLGASLDLQIRF